MCWSMVLWQVQGTFVKSLSPEVISSESLTAAGAQGRAFSPDLTWQNLLPKEEHSFYRNFLQDDVAEAMDFVEKTICRSYKTCRWWLFCLVPVCLWASSLTFQGPEQLTMHFVLAFPKFLAGTPSHVGAEGDPHSSPSLGFCKLSQQRHANHAFGACVRCEWTLVK